MNIVLREPWSVERFLSWEDMQEGKHEFDGSRIIEMTGGSRTHQRIVFNLVRLLLDRLDPGAYDAVQEMRFEVAGKVRYPEVSVCHGRSPRSIRTIRGAVVIFAVLSDDTVENRPPRKARRICPTLKPAAIRPARTGSSSRRAMGMRARPVENHPRHNWHHRCA